MRKYLTEGLIIAGAPVMLYLYSFFFNMGTSQYFRVPSEIVSFSMPSLLNIIIAVIAGFVLLGSWQLFMGISVKGEKPLPTIMFENIVILFIIGGILYYLNIVGSALLFILIGFIYALLHFVWPLITFRKVEGYFNKINDHATKRIAASETFGDLLFNAAYYRYFTWVAFAMGSLLITFGYGHFSASKQASFYTLDGNSHWIVIRYLDNAALVVEQNNNQLANSFKVVPFTNSGTGIDHTFVFKEIGTVKR